jgi:hypothetical protein
MLCVGLTGMVEGTDWICALVNVLLVRVDWLGWSKRGNRGLSRLRGFEEVVVVDAIEMTES